MFRFSLPVFQMRAGGNFGGGVGGSGFLGRGSRFSSSNNSGHRRPYSGQSTSAGNTLNGYSIWRNRGPPSLAGHHSSPQTVSKSYFHSTTRKRLEPDDPTRTLTMGQVSLMRCPNCKRTKMVPPGESTRFLSCCEIFELQPVDQSRGNVKKTMRRQKKLMDTVRLWDFERNKPKSNLHKPMTGAQAKLGKSMKKRKVMTF